MDLDALYVPLPIMTLRIVLATVLGGLMGFDRESRNKPAGLRTYMMVSLGACVFTIVTIELFRAASAIEDQARTDPVRIVEGVIGGIGFLGAGAIIQARGKVEGITTAAGLWVAGALGLACGAGSYLLAGITTLMALIILRGVGILESRFKKSDER